jgi:hypothetical protein
MDDKAFARELLGEEQGKDPSFVLSGSFPQQRAFVEDPHRLKALFCSRRAAKSFSVGLFLFYSALKYAGSNGLFVGLTKQSAYEICWKDVFHVLDEQFCLCAKFNEVKQTVTFPNRSVIRVTGADVDDHEMKKLLGKKYKAVGIDEASMFTISIQALVNLLEPAMVDQQGTIALAGTASNLARGLFYDITTGDPQGWKVHTWSAEDNPYVAAQWKAQLADIARDRPLYVQTPQYRQWFLNEWVVDQEKLVYRFNEDINVYHVLPTLPAAGWTYVLGIDLGWEDDNAFVLLGYHVNDPHLYIIKTFNKPKMTFDEVERMVKVFMSDPVMSPQNIVIDGANKQGVETMRARTGIPFEAADKRGKVEHIELMNAGFIQGQILVNAKLKTYISELKTVLWRTDSDDKIILPKEEHPACSNHLCDGGLYGFIKSYHYQSSRFIIEPVIGTKAWAEKMHEMVWEKERERMVAMQQDEENGGWSIL